VQIGRKGNYTQSIINACLPRFEYIDLSESMMDIKKKIFKRIRCIFKTPKNGGDFDDEWINKNLILHIKDNTPDIEVSSMITRKAVCEFCGNKHNMRDDICDIRTKKYKKDGNTMDASTNITLQDLYD
jgi:hypothetical protein